MPREEKWASKQEKKIKILMKEYFPETKDDINLHLQGTHWGLPVRKKITKLQSYKFYLSLILYLAYLRNIQLK